MSTAFSPSTFTTYSSSSSASCGVFIGTVPTGVIRSRYSPQISAQYRLSARQVVRLTSSSSKCALTNPKLGYSTQKSRPISSSRSYINLGNIEVARSKVFLVGKPQNGERLVLNSRRCSDDSRYQRVLAIVPSNAGPTLSATLGPARSLM